MRDRVVSFGDELLVRVIKAVLRPIRTLYVRMKRRGRRTYVRVAIRRANAPAVDDPHLATPQRGEC